MLNKKVLFAALSFFLLAVIGAGQTQRADYDVIIRNGMVYDGTGGAPLRADVGVRDNQIGAIGDLSKAKATNEIDARGMAVAPGFINMLSHSETSLIADYRSLGELRQGVTTQIFGESSMGPLSDEMKKTQLASQGDIKFDIPWTTLAEYLKYLEHRGVSQNVASFIGAGTVRTHVIGLEDKPPTPAQLEQMKIAAEMRAPTNEWENMFLLPGSLDRILLVGFRSEKLKPLTGRTLAEVARMRGTDPTDTVMDLILEDRSRVGTVYFLMSEENIKKQIAQPWVSFGSDAASMAAEGVFLRSSTHPRAYGCFARLLGKYVRDEKVISLEEAVRRLSGLPATNLELDRRGFLRNGYFADIVVFDPQTIADKATFENPHQYSVGVKHVFVNGAQALKDGEHTGAKPGKALWGPGKIKGVTE